jgi:hypothetical protein
VIHEHEQLEIASAAMDFPLALDVERELQHELADCPVCAERAASYHEQITLMRRLPVMNASEATRRRVTAAALGRHRDRGSPMLLLVAAALLLGLTLAVSAFVGTYLLRPTPPDLGLVEASPTTPDATTVVEQRPPTASPGAVAAAIPAGSIVEVVSGNLRVRSQPRVSNDSTKFLPLLLTGDRLFVVDGPVRASEYDWYKVVPINTTPDRPWDRLPTGWVSRGDHDGTPWIDAVPFQCPEGPVDIVMLSAMHPYDRLACYGSGDLTFRAVVRGTSDQGWRAEAAAGGSGSGSPTSGPLLALDRTGSAGPTDLPDGAIVLLEGGFDRADRFECPTDDAIDPVINDFDCRSVFVVEQASPAR